MGTTATAIQNGAGIFVYCIRIEGYPYIIASTSDTAAVVTAFSGSGYTSALPGLHHPGDYDQRIDPFSDSIGSGSMTFVVSPDQNDTFAKDLFAVNKTGGQWARLDTNADPSDLAFVWADTSDLDSSGTLYIGNEDTPYTGKTSTTTTGHTRADHTPMTASDGDNFARQYKIGITAGEQTSFPYATDFKRNWVGSWVVCTVHRVVDGVIDVLAQAETIFAGTIADIEDDPAGVSRLVCVDAIEKLNTATLLNDQWTAEPPEGIYYPSFTIIEVTEYASDFPTGTDEYENTITMEWDGTYISSGMSTVPEVIAAINAWLREEWNSGNIENTWILKRYSRNARTEFQVRYDSTTALPTAANSLQKRAIVRMTPLLAGALGFDIESAATGSIGTVQVVTAGDVQKSSLSPPSTDTLRITSQFPYAHSAGFPDPRVQDFTATPIGNVSGSFVDQRADLPSWLAIGDQSSGTWGLVRFRKWVFVAKLISSTELNVIADPRLSEAFGSEQLVTWNPEFGSPPPSNDVFTRITDPVAAYKQVILIQDELDYIFLRMFASTGEAGYNHATYDAWDAQLSIDGGIPWSALGDNFVNSIRSLADRSTQSTMTLLIDRPTRAAEIIVPEMLIRNAYFAMKDGGLIAVSPTRPAQDASDPHVITSSHRSAPNGQGDMPDSSMSKDLIITEINIEYDRAPDGTYRSDASVINTQSSTDYGISRKLDIKLRNHYTLGNVNSKRSILELLAQLSGDILAFFGRPILIVSRTIDMTKAHTMLPGDTVFLSDNFVRDVKTGERGVSARPGWLLGISKRYGVEGMISDAIIALHDNDSLRTGFYSPAAIIDQASNTPPFTGGYDGAGKQIDLNPDGFSTPNEPSDASRFEVNDVVVIQEKSPPSPGSPQTWQTTVSSVSSDVITLADALTGFDSTKEYYITSAPYSSTQSTQKTKTFMGDNTTSKLASTVRNFEWNSQAIDLESYTAASTTDRFEYPIADGKWSADGSPVSPIIHRNGIIAANVINNRTTASQCPMMLYAGVASTSTTYELAAYWFPFYVSDAESFELFRVIHVGPAMKQTTSGTGTIRVTSSPTPPVSSDTIPGAGAAVSFVGPVNSIEFTNTATTYTNKTSSELRVAKAPGHPYTWITVEIKTTANTCTWYGFHEMWLSELRFS